MQDSTTLRLMIKILEMMLSCFMTSLLNVLLNKISKSRSEEQNVQKEGPRSFGIILFGIHFLGTYGFNTGT